MGAITKVLEKVDGMVQDEGGRGGVGWLDPGCTWKIEPAGFADAVLVGWRGAES